MINAVPKMLASRYEWKYLIPDAMVPELRRFMQPFVLSDPYAVDRRDARYPICSLYLDSADLKLCEQTRRGEKNRFKLRIRSYSDDSEAPVHFEIKRKIDRVLRKRRAAVPRQTVHDLLRSAQTAPASGRRRLQPAIEEFLSLTGGGAIGPVVRVGYQREPYESAAGDPVRITFDTKLCYRVTPGCSLNMNGEPWSSVPLNGTILEIKFTDRYPEWISEMVHCFELQRRSVAKYCLCMEAAIESGRYRPWSFAPSALEGV